MRIWACTSQPIFCRILCILFLLHYHLMLNSHTKMSQEKVKIKLNKLNVSLSQKLSCFLIFRCKNFLMFSYGVNDVITLVSHSHFVSYFSSFRSNFLFSSFHFDGRGILCVLLQPIYWVHAHFVLLKFVLSSSFFFFCHFELWKLF